MCASRSASSAGSFGWSGRSSWACRNRSASHQPSPTRNAIVPAAVARPVVSVSRQTSGTSGGGWPGMRASRSRSSGRTTVSGSQRTTAPRSLPDDLAVDGLRHEAREGRRSASDRPPTAAGSGRTAAR